MKRSFQFETTSCSLHIMAMAFMLCDHMWGISLVDHDVFTWVGRLAFPIFAFLLVEGYSHTGNLKRYAARLLVFALLSEIPFNLVMGSRVFYPIHQNVLWSFLISVGLIHWNEKVKTRRLWIRIMVAIATLCIAYVGGLATFVDYNHAGILTVLTFYYLRGTKWWNYVGQLLCMWFINVELLQGFGYEISLFGESFFIARQGIALLSLIPIWSYRGKQGYHSKRLQYVYYAFYPLHLLILGCLRFV